ncbi:MAG: 1-deoxy-D-xylulose-5-phosphate synthase [Oscillospiraceae bacterium]|nr:1-deoxy-D-xylulose-5-phosphate synthase [Oscillospiraceae bacterium]
MIRLEDIDSPAKLRQLSVAQLNELAGLLRRRIITTVARTGGHLASNLGVVELTIALLYCFDGIEDRVVWDVGHQSYAWKILTGRNDRFDTLRQEGGLAGFPKREESPYDAFNTGHSSTSISAALGISRGLRLQGKAGRVVAVIGDGALTGGLSYEALNNIDPDQDNLIVLVNDNQMSIDPNVGGLARQLRRFRINPQYLEIKGRVGRFLHRLPQQGGRLPRLLEQIKAVFRRLSHGSNGYFESLGMKYYGPVDGHNIAELIQYLSAARLMNAPVVIHSLTVKGKGYEPAEAKPSLYHGVSPFAVDQGVIGKTKAPLDRYRLFNDCTSFTEAFSASLMAYAAEDQAIVAVTAAMASGTGLTPFARQYPTRFFDVGIAEAHAVTMACGMAAAGLKPVVAVYSTFLQRALDQLLHDCVLQKLHVVFCVDRAGIVGEDGETHQGVYDLAFMEAVPDLTVLSPRDYRSLYEMLGYALNVCQGPVAIRYPRGGLALPAGALAHSPLTLPLPEPELLCAGSQLTMVASGSMVAQAVLAATELQAEAAVSCDVFDVRCLKPLHAEAVLRSAERTGRLLVAEEVVASGGLAMQLALQLAERTGGPKVLMTNLSIGDHPVLQAKAVQARAHEGLDKDGIKRAARQLLAEEEAVVS